MASIFCRYSMHSGFEGGTKICNNTDSFSDIKLNGVSIGLVTEKYTNIDSVFEFVLKDTTIGANAFLGSWPMMTLVIPEGITTIGDSAFGNLSNITDVDIPDSVISMGANVFKGCSQLNKVGIGSGLTSLPDSAFEGCEWLRSITIPENITSIGNNAFANCTELHSVFIRNANCVISNNSFDGVSQYGNLYYPSGADYSKWLTGGIQDWGTIPVDDFNNIPNRVNPSNTGGLTLVCKYDDNVYQSSKTGYLFAKSKLDYVSDVKINGTSIGVVWLYPGLAPNDEVEIVLIGTEIPDSMFHNCITLYDISIPEGITSIGDEAFYNARMLPAIHLPNSLTTIGDKAFQSCNSLNSINIHSGITSIGKLAFANTGLLYVKIPEQITEIGDGWFGACHILQEVDIHDGVTYFDGDAFSSCRALTSIHIPENSIVDLVFGGCSKIKSFTIPESVKKINTYGVGHMYCLETITIPKNVTSIGNYAFQQCASLKEIIVESPSCEVSDYTFYRIAYNGKLHTPLNSDYSQWVSSEPYYLGYYGWNEDGIFELTPHIMNVPSSGSTEYIEVTKHAITNIEIETPDWVSLTETDTGYEVVISPNPSVDQRNGEVLFTAYNGPVTINKVVSIQQKGVDMFLNISPTNINAPSKGLTTDINVDTNASNVDVVYPDWVEVSKKDDSTYEVIISKETKGELRESEIVFTASAEGQSSITKKVTINQEAYERGYVILSDNEFLLNDESDTREMEVTYVNIPEIITPVIPEGYEIVGEERTEPSTNVVQVKYKIQKTSANVGVFTTDFKGVDGNGNTVVSEPLTVDGWPSAKKGAELDGFRFWGVVEDTDFHHIFGMEDTFIFQYESEERYIEFNINGYTKPFEVSCTVNDPNGVLTFTNGVLYYDDGQDCAVYRLFFNSTGNSTNAPLEGTIDIHYTDEKTNFSKTIPFYVRFANQGLIDPFSINYKFDKDGVKISNDSDIGVGYFNIQTINTPTCSPWISLSAPHSEGKYYETGKSYRYDITVQPNDGAERTGAMTFSGLGVDGKTWVAEVELFQEGDDTVQIIDEGFIELQSLSVVLPAEGGSDTFQVKYYDAYSIELPELVGNWATITETSRTSPVADVAWNGEQCTSVIVTYTVTAGATTSGREMKVICRSKINSYDGSYISMKKDKFRIQQLAPGSTEFTGRVIPFRNEATYTYYGSGDSLRVGYKDVTILDPTISANWLSIKSITDKTSSSSEYDKINEYEIQMDTNRSEVSRTATITFRGRNEDSTTTQSIVTITQKGMEQKDDAGNYNNYRGYFTDLDGKLYSVSIITDPNSTAFGEIILAGESPVVVSYSESERLYTPMRTSTCTVKVVSERYLMDIYTGKAQGTQVILKDEDTGEIKWCGFLQPNLYNQGFSAPVETIELEASDCLSTLQYLDYRNYYVNGRMTISFRDIIESILDRSKLINTYYLTQRLYSDAFQSRNLRFHDLFIAEQNFFSEEDEPWKLKEVLEEICKYMGLVCFQWGDAIYFLDYDMYNTSKKMIGYKFTKQRRWNDQELVVIANTANKVVMESYRGTGADFSLDDVFNKVSVNCSYYDVEDLIPDLFEDDFLTNRFGEGSMFSISRYTGRGNSTLSNKTFYKVYDHKNIDSLYYLPLNRPGTGGYETKAIPTDKDFEDKYFFRKYVGGNIIDMIHLGYDEANGKPGESKDWDRYLLISQLNRPWCGSEGTFHWEEYNFPIMEFKDLPVIFLDNTGDENVERTVLTRSGIGTTSSRPNNRQPKPVSVPNYLVIEAEAIFGIEFNKEYHEGLAEGLTHKRGKDYYNYGDAYTFNHIRNTPALCFYLEIPQAGWWDGTKWVHYKTHFEVPLEYFGENKDDDKFYEHLWGVSKGVENTIATNLFLGTTGYKIPLPKDMTTTQQMYFAIAMPKRFVHLSDSYGGDYTGKAGNAYCFIKDFSMKIVNRNSALYEEEDVIYENIIDEDNVIDGDEIELKITSDRYMGYSYSNVSTIKADGTPTTDIMFYNKDYELVKPEEGIIERYVNQYSTPSIKTNLTLDMSFVPYELITDTYWNKNFVIIGQEIDYQMARQEITLLEKK